jgi:hypothetical protein
MDTHKTIVQTVGKAAAKTFLQAFLAVFVPLFILWATSNTAMLTNEQSGGNIDIDFKPVAAALIAAAIAGVSSVLSAAWNLSKGPTSQTPVVDSPPVVVDK